MNWIVYCTTCTENGKIYIGVHKTDNPNVFDGYIGNGINMGWNIKNPHTAFQYAIKKYGYNKFKRSVLYVFDNEELAYAKEAEIVNKDFIKRHDNYNTSLGGIHSGVIYDSLYQYSLNGEFIKEWSSVGDAIKYYGCNSNRFNMCIKDKRSAYNSYWIAIYDKPTKRTFNGDKSHKEKLFHIDLSKYGGLCRYEFEKFFQEKDIECEIDLQIQELFLEKINELIDKKILKLGE